MHNTDGIGTYGVVSAHKITHGGVDPLATRVNARQSHAVAVDPFRARQSVAAVVAPVVESDPYADAIAAVLAERERWGDNVIGRVNGRPVTA